MLREIVEGMGQKVFGLKFDDVDVIIDSFSKLDKVDLKRIQNMPDSEYWGQGNTIFSISKEIIDIIAKLAKEQGIVFKRVRQLKKKA